MSTTPPPVAEVSLSATDENTVALAVAAAAETVEPVFRQFVAQLRRSRPAVAPPPAPRPGRPEAATRVFCLGG